MITRRSFWRRVLGGLGIGAVITSPSTGVVLPLVGQGGLVPMYFIDNDNGKDHPGFPYQECPHKTLDFFNEDSRRHRQWIFYVRKDNDVDPQYVEAWSVYYGPESWSEMR